MKRKQTHKFGKMELARALESNCRLSSDQAERCVAAVWDRMTDALQTGAVIKLRGIGILSTSPSRTPHRRNVRFAISRKLLDEADSHRPAADPEQVQSRTMIKISNSVEHLIGVRPSRHVLENLLLHARYKQEELLAVLTGMIRGNRVYMPQDVQIFLNEAAGELARRSSGRYP